MSSYCEETHTLKIHGKRQKLARLVSFFSAFLRIVVRYYFATFSFKQLSSLESQRKLAVK